MSYVGWQYRRLCVQTKHVTFHYATCVWVEKLPKGSKTALGRQGKCAIRLISVPKWKEGPETMQKTERKREKPQIDKAVPSRVANSIVKESILWLGFKRPSMYWGWKVDANGFASIYKQVSEIGMVHTLAKRRLIQAALQSSSCSSCSKRPAKRIITSSNQYDHI